jgi:hypothetical protein
MYDDDYDHRPEMPDDYWDKADYLYGQAQQKKLDMEPDGDPYEERKLMEAA